MQRDTHFQILSDIEYPGNIKRALFVEVPERVSEICRLDLPYPHEDQLMVWMTAQKHSEKLAGILQAYLVPVGVLRAIAVSTKGIRCMMCMALTGTWSKPI